MIGEDEAGYFHLFYIVCFVIFNDPNSLKFNFDYIDTYSGIKNYS